MNRSILIVICDFLVSAMLSMMTGMVPAHSGGTGVGLDENTTRLLLVELENKSRELENLRAQLRMAADRAENFAKLQEINAQLAENKMQQQALKDTLKRTPANTGELSPQELKKLLDNERLERLRLEYEIRDRDDDLADDELQPFIVAVYIFTAGLHIYGNAVLDQIWLEAADCGINGVLQRKFPYHVILADCV